MSVGSSHKWISNFICGALIMSYKLTKYLKSDGTYVNKTVIRLSDGASIPFDEGNTDYQQYLEWAKTNNAEEAD